MNGLPKSCYLVFATGITQRRLNFLDGLIVIKPAEDVVIALVIRLHLWLILELLNFYVCQPRPILPGQGILFVKHGLCKVGKGIFITFLKVFQPSDFLAKVGFGFH